MSVLGKALADHSLHTLDHIPLLLNGPGSAFLDIMTPPDED